MTYSWKQKESNGDIDVSLSLHTTFQLFHLTKQGMLSELLKLNFTSQKY